MLKKSKKTIRRLGAVVMALAMAMSVMMVNAFAVDAPTPPVKFTKTLDMSGAVGASVPDVTFTYGIAAGTAVAAYTDDESVEHPEILAGVQSDKIVMGTAAFSHEDSVDASNTVSKDVSVDFTNVTFSAPGIYRYIITEQPYAAVEGAFDYSNNITMDATATRYLDVYVTYVNGALAISNYVVLKDVSNQPTTGEGQTGTDVSYGSNRTTKSEGYKNTYTTKQLTLKKIVDGNAADKGATYNFTINFVGPANASFTYGERKIQLDEKGEASVGIALKNGETSTAIQGIPANVTYTVTETIAKSAGYTTTFKVNTTDTTATFDGDGTAITTGSITMGTTDNAVECTNYKATNTPTGVIMNIAPYVLMVALAGGIAFFFLRRRNAE